MNEACKRVEYKGEYGHLSENYFTDSVKPTIERLIRSMIKTTEMYSFTLKIISFDGVDYTDFEQAYEAIRKWASK